MEGGRSLTRLEIFYKITTSELQTLPISEARKTSTNNHKPRRKQKTVSVINIADIYKPKKIIPKNY